MSSLADPFLALGTLDALAAGTSPIHRLDPRAKVLAVAGFVTAVASFGRYEVAALLPFALFPAAVMVLSDTPAGFLLRRVLAALPFVLVLGILNPVLDRAPMVHLGPVSLAGGWLSFASILLRFALTVSSALILVATTRFDDVCLALERLGLPRAFTLQLAFLYRYAFVLAAETRRLAQARRLRAFGRKVTLKEFGTLAAHLLLRTWDRARRIHQAMQARGFTGQFRPRGPRHWRLADTLYTVGWLALFLVLRCIPVPQLLGKLAAGGLG
jgi:cobalt/nickel transport system permease protein